MRYLHALILALTFALTIGPPSIAQTRAPESGIVIDPENLRLSAEVVSKGDVLISMPARFLRTGRLTNEMRAVGGIFGAPKNSVGAGTPVFAQSFEKLGVQWCAVSAWYDRLMTVCFVPFEKGPDSVAYLGLPYTATTITPDYRIEGVPEVVEDPNAELPAMEMVYIFDRWQKDGLRAWRGLRVNGVVYRDTLQLNRYAREGVVRLSFQGRIVEVIQSKDKKARVSAIAE